MTFGNYTIKTHFEHPPIPLRNHDWVAWIEGQEEWKRGAGLTELEALLDLYEQLVNDGVLSELSWMRAHDECVVNATIINITNV